MSLTFKLLSLAIRTAAKPIGNYIKRQAKEHDGFRYFAVQQAQRVHRIDMRMRLGILHDSAAQERMAERERVKEEEKKRQAETPTVLSEEQQKRADETAAREKEDGGKKQSDKKAAVKIRPLSEAKAIELGANFFSESFIFLVAAGLLVWDSWRSRRKESSRHDEVAERLEALEAEVARLRGRHQLEALDKEEKEEPTPWYNPKGWWMRTEPRPSDVEALDVVHGPAATAKQTMQRVKEEGSDLTTSVATKVSSSIVGKEVLPVKKDSTADRSAERVDTVVASSKAR